MADGIHHGGNSGGRGIVGAALLTQSQYFGTRMPGTLVDTGNTFIVEESASMREASSTPAMPNTRCLSQPVRFQACQVSTSTGLLTSSNRASGAYSSTLSQILSMTARFISSTSLRDIPGLRGEPAVTTTSSESLSRAGSVPPLTRVSNFTDTAGANDADLVHAVLFMAEDWRS
jgi:hypothetical protein